MKEYVAKDDILEEFRSAIRASCLCLSDIGVGLQVANSIVEKLPVVTEADMYREFATWLASLSRDESDPLIERNANRWIDDFIESRREQGMDKLRKAKEIIEAHIDNARCGLFNCSNVLGDTMCTLYEDEELEIDICYGYSYFEVFGLDSEEFVELERFYNRLCSMNR